MKLPNIKEIISQSPSRYVDIDAIINHSQTDRRAKIDAYISVIFPDEQSFLFFKKGELYNSGKIVENEFKETTLVSVLKKIRSFKNKDEDATLEFAEINDELLMAFLNVFYIKPNYNLNSKFGDVKKLFSILIKNKYNGFIEFIYQNCLNFLFVKNGELSSINVSDDLRMYLEEANNDISIILDTLIHLFNKEKDAVYINIYNKSVGIKPQLSPNIIELMEKIVKKTIEEIGKEHSPENLVKYFNLGLDKLSKKTPELKDAVIKEDKVDFSGIDLETKVFATAISLVFNEFIDKLNLVFGATVVNKVFDIIKDFRFALERVGFFEKSYMKSLL
jgi:hypothetical protein